MQLCFTLFYTKQKPTNLRNYKTDIKTRHNNIKPKKKKKGIIETTKKGKDFFKKKDSTVYCYQSVNVFVLFVS